MAENVKTKRATGKKTPRKTVVEPFAETVDRPAEKETVQKKAAATAVEAKPVKKAAAKKPAGRKAVVKKAAVRTVDPFAEVATTDAEPAPVKKSTTKKSRSLKAKAPLPKAAKPAEAKQKRTVNTKKPTLDVTAEFAATEPLTELSPVFKALADVKLPELGRENRARLQMQSPTRLYFYWSLKENPWQQLRRVFGDDLGAYRLVVKLVDLTHDIEHIHPCDADGNWWFAAEPGTEYQAEIGFFATNRPYFRVLYSNTIFTPLRSPSPRPAEQARWTVSATKFAEVLDASGFSQDAFNVAISGDDVYGADRDARRAFSRFVDGGKYDFADIAGHDIRYVMAALAGGASLEELRWKVSERLFAILQSNAAKLNAGSARSAIDEYFDVDEFTIDESPSAVFGASLVHFPRTLKSRQRTRYNPISSYSIR